MNMIMKRNDYQKPAMRVVKLQRMGIICASTLQSVNRAQTNLADEDAIEYLGSSTNYSGDAR